MANRVTLLIFCYVLFLTHEFTASEETSSTTSKPAQTGSTHMGKLTSIPSSSKAPNHTQDTGNKASPTTAAQPSGGGQDLPNATTTESRLGEGGTPSTTASTSAQSNESSANTTTMQSISLTASPTSSGLKSEQENTSASTLKTNSSIGPQDGVTSSYGHQKTPVSTNKTSNTELDQKDTTKDNVNQTEGTENSGPHSDEKPEAAQFQPRYLWLLLLVVAVVAVLIYMKFKCFKVHHHPVEAMDHGTENASFQRTESNKDGVMLLGVKSGGEENAAAK